MIDHTDADQHAKKMDDRPSGPLLGVRILDLTRALSGPYCTMMLADLGADVVKVEPPEGDMTRFGGPFMRDDTERAFGAYFASINRNKRGIVLDLRQEEGRETLLRLVDKADALVENFKPGVMERIGLPYEVLHERNPRLLYGAIRGFGDPRTGESPYNGWPAFDVVAQAMSGVVSITGTADGEMLRAGPSIGDLYPATVAALAITAGILHARASGQGQFVDVALYDALVALCESAVYQYSYTGRIMSPTGNSHPHLQPFDVYPTADGACAIAAPTDNHWTLLVGLMGRPDLLTDPRTKANRDRVRNTAFVRDTITEWAAGRSTAEIVELLAEKVPVGPVNRAPDLLLDPHLKTREMLVAIDHPGTPRPGVFPASPMRYTETPTSVHRRAPRLGEHNDEVLAEWGT